MSDLGNSAAGPVLPRNPLLTGVTAVVLTHMRPHLAGNVTRSLIERVLREPRPEQAPDQRRLQASVEALTQREREVMVMVGEGMSNDDIAVRLALSCHTVKTHVNRAMTKLDAHDRAQLVVIAYESGILRPRKGWTASAQRL